MVENILKHRKTGLEWEFLVQWDRFPDPTWECLDNLLIQLGGKVWPNEDLQQYLDDHHLDSVADALKVRCLELEKMSEDVGLHPVLGRGAKKDDEVEKLQPAAVKFSFKKPN